MMWTGFIWLRTGSVVSSCKHCNEPWYSTEGRENLTTWATYYPLQNCSMELLDQSLSWDKTFGYNWQLNTDIDLKNSCIIQMSILLQIRNAWTFSGSQLLLYQFFTVQNVNIYIMYMVCVH
jgi:hypothetical protein